jgi:hypothetical protein
MGGVASSILAFSSVISFLYLLYIKEFFWAGGDSRLGDA